MKRYVIMITISLILILGIVVLLSSKQFKTTYAAGDCTLLGDVNQDGVTDKKDALLIARYVIDSDTMMSLECAKINSDSLIKMDDAMWIIKGKVISLSLSKTTATLDIGGNTTFNVLFNPSTVVNKNVTWTTSNSSVASVNTNGKVTAVGSGVATITAKSLSDNTKKATAKVVVNDILPTSVTLSQPGGTYYVNGAYNLTATVSPNNASNKTVTWLSSDSSIATVENGVVTTKTAGTVTIVASTSNDKKATVTMNINNPYIKEDTYPYEYKDGSAELTIEAKTYTSTISSGTTAYHLAHLKITDYGRLHTGVTGNGTSTDSSCGKNVYKVDKTTGSVTYVGTNCGKISDAATREGALFAVEADYALNGGHTACNGLKGSYRDGEYYFVNSNQVDLSTVTASKIAFGFYNKKTGVMGPASTLGSGTALDALNLGNVSDTFCFSSNLVVNGTYANTAYMTSTTARRQSNFVGYKGPGEFYFVIAEGIHADNTTIPSDRESYGLLPKDRAQILIDLGCTYGMQLDGGQSIIVWFRGRQLQNRQVVYEERAWLTDFVYFK